MIYAFVLLRFKVVGPEEIGALPKGRLVLRVLKKLRWV